MPFHVWRFIYPAPTCDEDIFDLQDRITMSVIGAISPQLERAESSALSANQLKAFRRTTTIFAVLLTFIGLPAKRIWKRSN